MIDGATGNSYSPPVFASGIGTITIAPPADNTAPTISTLTVSPSTWTTQATVNLSATISDNDEIAKYYKTCSATETPVAVPVAGNHQSTSVLFTCNLQGTNTASITVEDISGNKSLTKTVQYKIDHTAPTATDDYNDSAWKQTAQTVTLTFSDAHSGINTGTRLYCIDTANSCTPNVNYSAPLTMSTSGASYVRYQVSDNIGNSSGVQSKRVRIDTTPPLNPTVFMAKISDKDANGLTIGVNNPTIVFTWSGATDPESQIGDYQIVLQKESTNSAWTYDKLTGNVNTYTLSTANLEDGQSYIYWIRAKNGAGKENASFFSGGKFTINLALSEPAFARCARWGGKWTGSGADTQQNGVCSFIDSAEKIALHKEVVDALPVICQSLELTNGLLTGCTAASPRWAKQNFTLPSGATKYARVASPSWGINLPSKTSASNCTTTDFYLENSYENPGNPGRGDYCPQKGQKTKAAPTYTGDTAASYFTGCGLNEACACTTSSKPLGLEYFFLTPNITTASGTNITGVGLRVRSFTAGSDRSGGQCINEKIVKCLYLGGLSQSTTIYEVTDTVAHCRLPGTGTKPPQVYSWINGDWSLAGCPDGSRTDANGACVTTCTADDEGSSRCCSDGISWWHWNTAANTGSCLLPQRYECEVVMKTGIPESTAANPILNSYPVDDYPFGASATYSTASRACRVSCDDATNVPGLTISRPNGVMEAGAWRWRAGASSLNLLLNASVAPYFQGATNGSCAWECAPNFVRVGNTCQREQTVTPVGPQVPPEGDVLPRVPAHPILNVTAASFNALIRRDPEHWTDQFFRSPALDATDADQLSFWLRFRIAKDASLSVLPNQELLRWKIVGKDADGNVRTLTARPGCFDPKHSGTGGMLCLDHFRTANYYDPRVVNDGDDADFYGVFFDNPSGLDSATGEPMSITAFLASGIFYPELRLEYINTIHDASGIPVKLNYQIFVDTPAEVSSLPAGIPLLRIITEIGGLRRILEASIQAHSIIPFLNYVISTE